MQEKNWKDQKNFKQIKKAGDDQMLVLNRKSNEEIYIETPEGRITVKVIEIDGKFAKIGIDAPRSFPVYREELYKQVNDENKQSVIKNGKIMNIADMFKDFKNDRQCSVHAVSYTHLTLPTILLVQISVVAGSLKKKKNRFLAAESEQGQAKLILIRAVVAKKGA
eukprot:TRINITY_DN31272_c0_g1_i1.p2 TRINITY_DN31272_c0_g1~~TRINITY_DN31272_c0_g1_i1.p2  ORF type:complete len:165 (-),score=29.82 TRINITY_DN31272_c0_g1_i1:10-504(-)